MALVYRLQLLRMKWVKTRGAFRIVPGESINRLINGLRHCNKRRSLLWCVLFREIMKSSSLSISVIGLVPNCPAQYRWDSSWGDNILRPTEATRRGVPKGQGMCKRRMASQTATVNPNAPETQVGLMVASDQERAFKASRQNRSFDRV